MPENDDQQQGDNQGQTVTPEDLNNLRSQKDKEIAERDKRLTDLESRLEEVAKSKPSTEYGKAKQASEDQSSREQFEQEKQKIAESRDAYWQKVLEAKEAGIPQNVLEAAGNTADDVGKVMAIYQALSGGSKDSDNPPGNGRVGNSPSSSSGSSWSDMDSGDRMRDWVGKNLSPITKPRSSS